MTHTIDLDADPFAPEGSTVEEHIKGGKFLLPATGPQVVYMERPWQRKEDRDFIAKFLKNLRDQNPINANLLDYLLANSHLIPQGAVFSPRLFFFGTTYRLSENKLLYVRYLRWDSDKKEWGWGWYRGRALSAWGEEIYIPVLTAA